MKKIFIFSIILFISFLTKDIFAQPDPGISNGEFMIVNHASYPIMYKMYPIGGVFNGKKNIPCMLPTHLVMVDHLS